MYFVKTPWYLKSVYPSLVWDLPKTDTLYLTFDDGPVPGVTDIVLDILAGFQAQATFFCIGDNIQKHPELFQRIKHEGHAVGNHTFHHVNGWRTDLSTYIEEVGACETLVQTKLFRPPYGRISYHQIQELKKEYSIVMWDVLSGDFDTTLQSEACVQQVIEHAVGGSIVVFHDSLKAADRVLPALPQVLKHFAEKGFSFRALPYDSAALPKGLHLD